MTPLVLAVALRPRRSILLPGDAEKQVEREILSRTVPEAMHSDVLRSVIRKQEFDDAGIPRYVERVSESYRR